MESFESHGLILLSGCEVMELPELVPPARGIYMIFFKGGRRLLEETGYFLTEQQEPLSIADTVHLYTGAAANLRRRIAQHFLRDVRMSNLRKTLLAIEHAKHAVSRSGTPKCHIKDEKTLGMWLYRNALLAVGCAHEQFKAERMLLSRFASPFNIRARRASPYSQALIRWRAASFPSRSHRGKRTHSIPKLLPAPRGAAVN